MIVLGFDDGEVELALGDGLVPPNRKGAPDNLYCNRGCVWARLKGRPVWYPVEITNSLRAATSMVRGMKSAQCALKVLVGNKADL